jgi:DnaJ-domain-containing protein 1
MTDCFALLDEPRRPWSDPEALKRKFLELSAQQHPDRTHGAAAEDQRSAHARYASLNAAYQCLREPKDRLKHLLELETGKRPTDLQTIDPDLMAFFMEITHLCRAVDEFLARAAKVSSPLLKVKLFEEGQEMSERLRNLQGMINARTVKLFEELKALDSLWEINAAGNTGQRQELLRQVERLSHLFGFCSRWSVQVQDRIVQLAS